MRLMSWGWIYILVFFYIGVGYCNPVQIQPNISQEKGQYDLPDTVHPPLSPQKDVKVTYEFKAGKKDIDQNIPMKEVTMWFSSQGDHLRIEPKDAKAITIIDRPAQKVTLLNMIGKSYFQFLPLHGVRAPFMLDLSMHFTMQGKNNIAGHDCYNWTFKASHNGTGTACVTDDGLILYEKGVDADGVEGELIAKTVQYGPIMASVFAPPVGYVHLQPHLKEPADSKNSDDNKKK